MVIIYLVDSMVPSNAELSCGSSMVTAKGG